VNPEIQTFLLAMMPVSELRASLPIALTAYQLNWGIAYLNSVIGNLIPVVFLLLFLKPVSGWLSENFKFFQKFFFWFSERTKKNHDSRFKNQRDLALIAFVAIPLPGTGGWTAAIIAVLLGIPFKKAFLLIALGLALAGLIVSAITFTGISIEKYFGWQILAGILLTLGLAWLIYNIYNLKNKKYA